MKNAPTEVSALKNGTSESNQTLAQPITTGNTDGFHGASKEAWNHFDLVLGLGGDLLPVVSDPTAVISPRSSMNDKGKTPSLFNREGHVAGIKDWTKKVATQAEIVKWSKDNRLGICLQTRLARAIDADVTDFDEAYDIEGFLDANIGFKLPVRRRSNSTKFLMLFNMPGEFYKRAFKTKTAGSKIEFLANGQQCIVQGRHPSGAMYEFDGGLPEVIPELTPEQFETLWSALNAKFGSEESVNARAGMSPTTRRKLEDANDPMVSYLEENWTVFDISDDGRIDILCPFADGHTDGLSEGSSTSYYPAGVGGFAQGHFRCLHASCAHRIDQNFRVEIGEAKHGFEVVEADEQLPVVTPPPNFVTIKSGPNIGRVKNTLENIVAALFRPDVCGYQLRFDTFRHGAMLSTPGVNEWRSLSDVDYSELRLRLGRPGHGHLGFEEIGKENIRDGVVYVASKSTFDTAVLWIESLKWDGVKRVETSIQKYFGAADTPYHRAIALYLWTALAGRVMVPGIKADMVPVAIGKQGTRKSSTVAAIVPASDFFVEADLSRKDDDLSRLMRGKLVVELGELKGLRKREAEHIKEFLTKQWEEWTPKYMEFNTRYARRCVFFGTSNEPEFLVDKTGHRRWLPFDAGECAPEGLTADRDQLWAEALTLFKLNGIMYSDAERLARNEHERYIERDAWEEAVVRYLLGEGMGEEAPMDSPFTAVMVLHGGLSIPISQINKAHKDRMGTLLAHLSTKLKLKKCKAYINGVQQRCYVRDTNHQ